MNGRLLRIAPTKSNLLALKRQLQLLEDGHALLERKRELLNRLVYQRIDSYRKLRSESRAAIHVAWRWLAIIQLRMGGQTLRQAALGANSALDIEILPRRAMGVIYPSVNARRLPLNPLGLSGTDASLDQARIQLADAMVSLARFAEMKTVLARLIREQRKTQKRVNALYYNIIPQYRDTIYRIEATLEEEARTTLFQVKVLREQRTMS